MFLTDNIKAIVKATLFSIMALVLRLGLWPQVSSEDNGGNSQDEDTPEELWDDDEAIVDMDQDSADQIVRELNRTPDMSS